jgi:hypothetical protein
MSNPVSPDSGADEAPAAITDDLQPAPTLEDESPVKAALERIRHAEELQARMQREYAQQVPQQAQTPQQPQLSQWKLDFLKANPELVENEEATSLTRYSYLSALRRGIRDDTPAMNEAILADWKRMRGAVESIGREPEREAPPVNVPIEPPKRSVPISAPVSRTAPSMATGSAPVRVVLLPHEVEMAHLSYRELPPEKAERLYWEMKVRMVRAKAAGEIQS